MRGELSAASHEGPDASSASSSAGSGQATVNPAQPSEQSAAASAHALAANSGALDLLKTVLAIPSVNGEHDEGAVADYLAAYLRRCGVEAQVNRIDERRANLVAFIAGKDSAVTELWNGHMDTVPYGSLEQWETDPGVPVESEGRLYARGASDMKSGLCAMVYALSHLPGKPAHNIRFLASCDEERNGLGAELAVREGLVDGCDFMLIGEPTGMRPGIAHKGCLWLKISVTGKTSHGAYPKDGVNAIHYLYMLAQDIIRYVESFVHPLLGSSTAQIDQICGGIAPNMTADSCEAVLDIRMIPGLTADMVLAHASGQLALYQAEASALRAVFTLLNHRRAFEIDEEDKTVVSMVRLLQTHGYAGSALGINFFTDASVLARTALDKRVLLFGPGEPAMAHQPNEYVELKQYLDAIEILKEFALEKKSV